MPRCSSKRGPEIINTKPFDNEELRARIEVGKRVVELQRELLYKEKLQGVVEMAGAICHEFNQPLQVISGQAELLSMHLGKNSPLLEKVKTIKRQVERIALLTKKVMNITKYASKDYGERSKIIDLEKAVG